MSDIISLKIQNILSDYNFVRWYKMTEKINKKVSDVSENKLAKDEELKKIALKIMEKYEKTFEVLAK